MTQGNSIIKTVSDRTDADSSTHHASKRPDSAEDALILQTEWVQPDPLGVLELGPDHELYEAESTLSPAEAGWEQPVSSKPKGSILNWLVPATGVTAILAWTAFFVFSHWQTMMAGAPLAQWTAWTSEWAIPVLLVAVALLLAMRNSHAEARRFGETAALLSRESRDLEERLTVVNRELSLAREFLGSQSRELDSLGRIAADRISTHAGALEGLIQENGTKLEAIERVSDTALSNMAKLRDDLPVIAHSAKDVSNQVGNAGRTAQEQLGKLVSGFERLNEFGSASERQVTSFDEKVRASLDNFDAQLSRLNDAANARFTALSARSDAFRADLLKSETEALEVMRERAENLRSDIGSMRETLASEESKSLGNLRQHIAMLRTDSETMSNALREKEAETLAGLGAAKDRFFEEMKEIISQIDALDQKAVASASERVKALHAEAKEYDERLRARDEQITQEIAQRQDTLKAREAAALDELAERLGQLDATLSDRAETQEKRARRLTHQSELIASQVEELKQLFEVISGTASSAEQTLNASLEGLQSRALDGEMHLSRTGKAVSDLTDASMRLMELIESSSVRANEVFPKAASQASAALQPVEDRAIMLSATMEETTARAERLAEYIRSTQTEIVGVDEALQNLRGTLSEHSQSMLGQVNTLRDTLRSLDTEGEKLTERTTRELSGAIARLQNSLQAAFATMEDGVQNRFDSATSALSADAATAIETALSERLDEVLARIEARAKTATGASKEAAEQLRAQLDEVSTLTGNLEMRVASARKQASEQTGADFTRRVSFLTESLNSHAIDIAGALSSEVTDTAWASYLKGDRGIFTRRAVKLLDSGQAREVAGLYQNDEEFRAHVNRYVHDFEQMLSTLLATPDGNAMSVTMLGSDNGKLYVALAQAIERLRN